MLEKAMMDPKTKNRNCGCCHQGMPYFFASATILNSDTISRIAIDKLYHT
jgi:hypothetical protein